MDVGTINTWLGYFGIYMLTGLFILATLVAFDHKRQILDFVRGNKKQVAETAVLNTEILALIKLTPKRPKSYRRAGLEMLVAWLFWGVALPAMLIGEIFRRPVPPWPSPDDQFECTLSDLCRHLSPEQAEAESMITDPLGVVPDMPFGHLNAGWKRFLAQGDVQDELWSFKILPKPHYKPVELPWERVVDGREGFAWVREGKIKAEFFTVWDSYE